MSQYLTAYLTTAFVFLALDAAWLALTAKRFYFDRLGELLLDKPRKGSAAAFYAVYVVGIVFFAVAPALRESAASTALLHGALFGFFAYATYDMTNYATLRNWSLAVSLVDTLWGTCLTAVAAFLGYYGTLLIIPA